MIKVRATPNIQSPPPPPPPPYYDNYSGPANPACFLTMDSSSKWAGQSFTTALIYNLERVDFWIKKGPGANVGNIEVILYAVDGNGHPIIEPGGNRLCNGVIPNADISEDYSWVSCNLFILRTGGGLTCFKLSAATKYCIVIHGNSLSVANPLIWACGGDGSGLPNGDQEWSINSGGTWTTDTTRDQLFQCYPTPWLDNYSGTETPFISYLLDSSGIWAGQSFTAMKSYPLTRIDVNIQKRGFVGVIEVKLFNVDMNGHPTGAHIARGTIPDADIPPSFSMDFVRCDLFDHHDVVVDTKYCIVVHGPGLGGANKIYIQGDNYSNDSDYAGGDKEWSINGGTSWVTSTVFDFVFRCYTD